MLKIISTVIFFVLNYIMHSQIIDLCNASISRRTQYIEQSRSIYKELSNFIQISRALYKYNESIVLSSIENTHSIAIKNIENNAAIQEQKLYKQHLNRIRSIEEAFMKKKPDIMNSLAQLRSPLMREAITVIEGNVIDKPNRGVS